MFNWFSKKSDDSAPSSGGGSDGGLRDSRGKSLSPRDKTPSIPAMKPVTVDPANRSEVRKARRHARREQLYIAVREAMTRGGVLASSYKFKVLSLDQRGDQFLIMMDVAYALGHQADKLEEIEGLVIQTAKARFELLVTAVYWRMEPRTATSPALKSLAHDVSPVASMGAADRSSATSHPAAQALPVKKPAGPRYEPIQDDEVAAFKQALAAASATSPVTVDASGQSRSGAHSYTLLTGFEDTEMPESAATPALSATQYGDLN